MFWPLTFFAADSDKLESLIEAEKEQEEKWLEETRELPAVFLWGDESGVQIDDPGAIGNPSALCTEVPYDQFLFNTNQSASWQDPELNTASPLLRQLLADTCLIRPTDQVLAVGEGWQQTVVLKKFVLRGSGSACDNEFPYSLWGQFDGPLPGSPLFFATDAELPSGDNNFAAIEWKTAGPLVSHEHPLRSPVPDLNDYTVALSSIGAANVDALYFLERRIMTLEDEDLPHHVIAWCSGERCETLWLERVSRKNGSGHIRVLGTLDFNFDGRRDLVLEGDKSGCAYKQIFQGLEIGFFPIETPTLACGC
jgi:hypothetical protein